MFGSALRFVHDTWMTLNSPKKERGGGTRSPEKSKGRRRKLIDVAFHLMMEKKRYYYTLIITKRPLARTTWFFLKQTQNPPPHLVGRWLVLFSWNRFGPNDRPWKLCWLFRVGRENQAALPPLLWSPPPAPASSLPALPGEGEGGALLCLVWFLLLRALLLSCPAPSRGSLFLFVAFRRCQTGGQEGGVLGQKTF